MKLLHCRMAFALVAVISIGLSASAQIIIDENFDSYNDDFDMETNWELGDGTLAIGFGNTSMDGMDNSANQPIFQPSGDAGNITSWVGTSISAMPSETQNVVLTADIYDDGLSSNERATIGLRSGANPLFEMGHYNNPAHFAFRLINIAGDTGSTNFGWQAFEMIDPEVNNASTEGWHRYQATFGETFVEITLDLLADGSIDAMYRLDGVNGGGTAISNPFTDLRFGGPSTVSSSGGGINIDNIRLEMVDATAPTADADFDGDGDIDGDDFLAWQAGYLVGTTAAEGDADGDGDVDADDLTAWASAYGTTPAASLSASAVPEPASIVLALFALLGFVAFQKRNS